MGLCPCCNKRLRTSRRVRNGFDDLGEEYDFSDEEVDVLSDEAIRRTAIPGGRRGSVRRTVSGWPRMLRPAEGAIRIGVKMHSTQGDVLVSYKKLFTRQSKRSAGPQARLDESQAGQDALRL